MFHLKKGIMFCLFIGRFARGGVMLEVAYYDGQIGSSKDVKVPFDDRTHFFGDGVYDATIAANGVVYLLEEHLDRFYSSAAQLEINVPMGKKELGDLINDLTGRVDSLTKFVYWQVSRGVAWRNHAYEPDMQGKISIFVRPCADIAKTLPAPVKAITVPDNRFELCNIKTLNLIPSVVAYQKAKKAGVFEAIFHRQGIVTECAHSNVSILKDGIFYSHPNDNFILRGIGKTHLIKACYRESVPVIERAFTLDELFDADEVIITSSADMCQAVCEIDGRKVGGKDAETMRKIGMSSLKEYFDITGL